MPLSHDRDTEGVLLLSYKVMSFCSKFTYLNFRRASGLCAGVRIYWIQTHLSAQRCCLCACSRGSLYKYSVLVHAHTHTHTRTAFALDTIPFHNICMNMYAASIYWIQTHLSAPLCCLCACSRGSLYKYSVLVHAHTYTHSICTRSNSFPQNMHEYVCC